MRHFRAGDFRAHCLDGTSKIRSLDVYPWTFFASAGMDLPRSGRPRQRTIAPRSSAVPRFAPKVVDEAISRSVPPDDTVTKLANDYARRGGGLPTAREKTFRPVFIDEVLIKILGYSRIDPDKPYTLADQRTLGAGSVTLRSGISRSEASSDRRAIELKGPDTKDLDRIMPGRAKTPVQQVWEYANDAPGAMGAGVELQRNQTYGYGRGRRRMNASTLLGSMIPANFIDCGRILARETFSAKRLNGSCTKPTRPMPMSQIDCIRIIGSYVRDLSRS